MYVLLYLETNFVLYTPETKFGGVYRSHPVVGRSVGRLVGRAVGRSVGPAVRCVFLFQYNFIQWSSTWRESAVHKKNNSILTYNRVIALCYFSLSGA